MTSAATKPKKEKPAPTTQMTKPPLKIADASTELSEDKELNRVVDTLRGRCLEMSFTVHGLPKNRRITGKMADQIANAVGGKRSGVRSSWSMFSSSHPAVANLNAATRDLLKLRDSWTIVRSAEVKKGDDALAIEGGRRLIWDKDVDEFYKLFIEKAKQIDKCAADVQYAMDHETTAYDQHDEEITVASIKDIDKGNAGDAWDEAAYPADVRKVVGVAKERDTKGEPILDAAGEPKFIISFEEYHVSEKLPKLLQERAEERLNAALSGTVETAMSYVVGELVDSVNTFKDELTTKIVLKPKMGSKHEYLTEHGICQVVKTVTSDSDTTVPAGQVKVFVRYIEREAGKADEAKTISRWLGPMPLATYEAELRPEATGEKKKIYPSVIEGIIAQMQAFRDKKAKMLGEYGDKVVSAFQPLLAQLTKYKELHTSNDEAAKRLANALKSSAERRQDIANAIGDAIQAMEEQVMAVRKVVRRRTIREV